MSLRNACVLLASVASTRADGGVWEAPLCFHAPVVYESDHCDPFVLSVGFGTCESGYAATWLGRCEREHPDDHDHWEPQSHLHIADFEHDAPAPPPSVSPEEASGDGASGDGASGDMACDPGTDPQGWVAPVGREATASVTAVVALDGTLATEGTLAAFVDGETRGVQSSTTMIPQVPAAGEYGGAIAWSITVSADLAEAGRTLAFQFARDAVAVRLDTTLAWQPDAIHGTALAPVRLKGGPACE